MRHTPKTPVSPEENERLYAEMIKRTSQKVGDAMKAAQDAGYIVGTENVEHPNMRGFSIFQVQVFERIM